MPAPRRSTGTTAPAGTSMRDALNPATTARTSKPTLRAKVVAVTGAADDAPKHAHETARPDRTTRTNKNVNALNRTIARAIPICGARTRATTTQHSAGTRNGAIHRGAPSSTVAVAMAPGDRSLATAAKKKTATSTVRDAEETVDIRRNQIVRERACFGHIRTASSTAVRRPSLGDSSSTTSSSSSLISKTSGAYPTHNPLLSHLRRSTTTCTRPFWPRFGCRCGSVLRAALNRPFGTSWRPVVFAPLAFPNVGSNELPGRPHR